MKIQKFYFYYFRVKYSSTDCRKTKTADIYMLQHYYMKFVIKNRLLKFQHESRRRPTLTSSLRKVLNRLESNFLGLETLIKGTVFLNFEKNRPRTFREKLKRRNQIYPMSNDVPKTHF